MLPVTTDVVSSSYARTVCTANTTNNMYAQIIRMALGQGLVGGSAASGTVLCTTLPTAATTTHSSNSNSSSVSDSPSSIGASPQPLARPPLAGCSSGTPAAVVSAAAAAAAAASATSSNSVMCVPLAAGSFYKSNSGSGSSSTATLSRASLAAAAAKSSADTEPVTVLAVLEAVRKLDTTTSPPTMIAFSDEVSVMVLKLSCLLYY
jgi:hypothetical protein